MVWTYKIEWPLKNLLQGTGTVVGGGGRKIGHQKKGWTESDNIHECTREEVCRDPGVCQESARMEECYVVIYHAVPRATTKQRVIGSVSNTQN